ncbi:MAG: hypothetical protein NZ870_05245, partial [bacterium]|nr:hypothetical protein [bacterium]
MSSLLIITFLLSIELKNEFIRVVYNEKNARFRVYTVKGIPEILTDDNKPMLFHELVEGQETSFLKLRIDGKEYIFGRNYERIIKQLTSGNRIEYGYEYSGVEVLQKLEVVKGDTTGNMDSIIISYKFKNITDSEKLLDVCLVLDTYLGKNDGAPFSIPGIGYITTDTEFISENIPSYWYALDSIKNPNVSAIGVIKVKGFKVPDRVVFTSWSNLYYSKSWYPELKQGRSFRSSALEGLDSAFAAFWSFKLKENESVNIGFIYGVYGVNIKVGDIVSAAISAPKKVIQDKNLTITCDIENTSNIKIDNLVVEL